MVTSACIRCGKPRIVTDTYEEQIGNSTVLFTNTECSDVACQKLVDQSLKQEESKRLHIKVDHDQREVERKRNFKRKRSLSSKKI